MAEEAPQHIQLKVKDQQGSEVQFKIKKSTPLRKLMDAYCSRLGLQASQVRFMVDGERIAPDDTAEKLGLEETAWAQLAHSDIVLLNKCDLEEAASTAEVCEKIEYEELRKMQGDDKIAVFRMSVLKGEGYQAAFRWVADFL